MKPRSSCLRALLKSGHASAPCQIRDENLPRLIWESNPVLSWQRLSQRRSSSATAKHSRSQTRFYRERQTEHKEGLIKGWETYESLPSKSDC